MSNVAIVDRNYMYLKNKTISMMRTNGKKVEDIGVDEKRIRDKKVFGYNNSAVQRMVYIVDGEYSFGGLYFSSSYSSQCKSNRNTRIKRRRQKKRGMA
jgi:hypothetical protein